MIAQRNLSLLSNRLAAGGGRRIPEEVVARDYCLAWFLACLGQSDLAPVLVFKGGTALKRCYFGDYRFSEDLDFTLSEPTAFDAIVKRLETVYAKVREESGIEFSFLREDRHSHANSYTFYLRFAGPLPRESDVKVDITLRECVVFSVQNRAVVRGYEEYTDLPEGRFIRVYALEEIVAEKIIALADSARNEPRDLYDLWYLTSVVNVEIGAFVLDAIRQKLEFRGRPSGSLETGIANKAERLSALWAKRLDYQMVQLPPFDEVLRIVRRTLRQAGLS